MKANHLAWNILTAAVVIVLGIPVILQLQKGGSVNWYYLNFLLAFFVLRWPAMVAHEAGHAVVARALGLEVTSVAIGVGRPLLSFTVGATRVAICSRSAMGVTHVAAPPELRSSAARVLVTIAAGPFVNLGLFLMVGLVTQVPGWGIDSPRWTTGWAPLEAFQWANLFCAIIALIPVRLGAPLGMVHTDGYSILFGIRKPETLRQRLAEAYYVTRAWESLRIGDVQSAIRWYDEGLALHPHSFPLRQSRAVASFQTGDFAGGRAQLVPFIGSKEESEYFAAPINKNAIAYADAMLGEPSLFDEADRYSREALDEAPKVAAFLGTRGAVLVQLGRVDEGRRLLERAYHQHSEPLARSADAAWLAIASARDGDVAQGRQWLVQAGTEYSGGLEIELAAQELGDIDVNAARPCSVR